MVAWDNLRKIVENIPDEATLLKRLKEISLETNSACAYEVVPFSHETIFYCAKTPSQLPDCLIQLSRQGIGYKGKLTTFTPAALRREENRGITCE